VIRTWLATSRPIWRAASYASQAAQRVLPDDVSDFSTQLRSLTLSLAKIIPVCKR